MNFRDILTQIAENSTMKNIILARYILDEILDKGVSEKLENEIDCSLIEDCSDHLQALIDYEPDDSVSSQQFERDGGYGLSAAERNK